jgi:hypothetical protein
MGEQCRRDPPPPVVEILILEPWLAMVDGSISHWVKWDHA